MMNPGPAEEVGHVATSIVDALKAQPAVLALTVANIGMMIFIFYALSSAAKFRETLLTQVYSERQQINDLLSRCVVPKTEGEEPWPGTEEKKRSSVTPSTNSPATFVTSITQAGDLVGWYCTTQLRQPFINGGTRSRPNRE